MTSGVMWHDMDLIQLVKQVLQLLYGNCSRFHRLTYPSILYPIILILILILILLLMGVALAWVCVVDTNPLRVSQHCIRY